MSEKMTQEVMLEPKKIIFREVDVPEPGPDQVIKSVPKS